MPLLLRRGAELARCALVHALQPPAIAAARRPAMADCEGGRAQGGEAHLTLSHAWPRRLSFPPAQAKLRAVSKPDLAQICLAHKLLSPASNARAFAARAARAGTADTPLAAVATLVAASTFARPAVVAKAKARAEVKAKATVVHCVDLHSAAPSRSEGKAASPSVSCGGGAFTRIQPRRRH